MSMYHINKHRPVTSSSVIFERSYVCKMWKLTCARYNHVVNKLPSTSTDFRCRHLIWRQCGEIWWDLMNLIDGSQIIHARMFIGQQSHSLMNTYSYLHTQYVDF